MGKCRTIIIVDNPDGTKSPYSTLTECCKMRDDFSIYYLRNVKLPIMYKGLYWIERITLNE